MDIHVNVSAMATAQEKINLLAYLKEEAHRIESDARIKFGRFVVKGVVVLE